MTRAASPDDSAALRLEAARHALLRRVSPSLRHKMMGALQPVGLLAALARRHGSAGKTDAVVECCDKLRAQTQTATAVTVSVLAWLATEDAPAIPASTGIEAYTELLRTDFEMRGMNVTLGAMTDAPVPARALREIFVGGLFAGTDAGSGSRIVHIDAQESGEQVEIALTVTAGPPREELGIVPERAITWQDLAALAAANDGRVNRESGRIFLHIPARRAGPAAVRPLSSPQREPRAAIP